jgi:hypothetical protein
MTTDTARRYAEKVRATLKLLAEADERNLDALTSTEFDAAKHELAAKEARGLRAALLLHAANLAEAVLAGDQTEPRYSLEEVHEAMQDAGRDMKGDDGPADFREYVAARLSVLGSRMAAPVAARCQSEFAGHACSRCHGHDGRHEDILTAQRWS